MADSSSSSTPAPQPHVDELGVTSAPLKSAAFFIGKFCQPYNGARSPVPVLAVPAHAPPADDFMQCKAEERDPAACLKEGRRVTRCATALSVAPRPRARGPN